MLAVPLDFKAPASQPGTPAHVTASVLERLPLWDRAAAEYGAEYLMRQSGAARTAVTSLSTASLTEARFASAITFIQAVLRGSQPPELRTRGCRSTS